jgi:Cysteine-rich CPXCG
LAPRNTTKSGASSRPATRRAAATSTALDPAAIDALYGLEPVYEPDAPARGSEPTEFVEIDCPYCGEPFETRVDLTAGSTCYVEDCQVCCQPIELSIDVADDGALAGVRPARLD